MVRKMAEPTVRILWGIAKSPELALTSEELHMIVAAHTGKDSIRELNRRELGTVIGVLQRMKDSASGKSRTDRRSRGNVGTVNQRKKIYQLCRKLGWDSPSRINGMCRRMFKVDAVEWLDYRQCSKLIEALKDMAGRMEKDEEQQAEKEQADNGTD
jgi:phage gp16-like protein